MSSILSEMLISAAAPAIVVAILFFVSGMRGDPLRARLQSLFFALGFAASAIFMVGKVEFPPQNVGLAFAFAALLLTVFVWINPKPVGSRYMLRALFVLAAGALVLWPIHQAIQGPVYTRNLLAFFFLGLGVWSILERSAQNVQTSTLVILPLLSLVCVAALILRHDGLAIVKVIALLSAMLAASGFVALIWPKKVSAAAILPFVSVLVVMTMAAGHFYLHINPWQMIYLCIPFLWLWIRGWLPFIPRRPVIEPLVFGVLSLLPMLYLLSSAGIKLTNP